MDDFKNINSNEEREALIKHLKDFIHPESVSFISVNENDDLSILLTIAEDLENFKLDLKIKERDIVDDNFLLNYVKNNLITRFSIKGKRSEQIVQISGDIIKNSQELQNNNPLSKLKF